MRLHLPVVSFVVIVALAACGKRDPVANDLKPVNLPMPANRAMPDAAGGPPQKQTEAAATAPATAPAELIPGPLQGRWGLTPTDCMLPPGKAKGLLIVNTDELRFYKSRAIPSANVQGGTTSISGDFRFTGEGRTWDKFEALQRNGHTLTRTESLGASYTYVRC